MARLSCVTPAEMTPRSGEVMATCTRGGADIRALRIRHTVLMRHRTRAPRSPAAATAQPRSPLTPMLPSHLDVIFRRLAMRIHRGAPWLERGSQEPGPRSIAGIHHDVGPEELCDAVATGNVSSCPRPTLPAPSGEQGQSTPPPHTTAGPCTQPRALSHVALRTPSGPASHDVKNLPAPYPALPTAESGLCCAAGWHSICVSPGQHTQWRKVRLASTCPHRSSTKVERTYVALPAGPVVLS